MDLQYNISVFKNSKLIESHTVDKEHKLLTICYLQDKYLKIIKKYY